jgi:hypothetical protein
MTERELAEEQFKRNVLATRQALAMLPKHRELLSKVRQYGFQAL